MATSLETLVVSIQADNKNIISRLDQADKKLAAFSKSAVGRISTIENRFSRIGASISKGFALLGSAAALGGLSRMVKGALDAADDINDLATKLGLSTTELQKFSYAAKLSGIEQGQLGSMVEKLNVSIAQSADKNSAAAKAFADLGIEVRDFGSTGSVFEAVMDRIAKSQLSAARQTELLRAVMGKGGAAAIQMAGDFDRLSKQAPIISDAQIQQAAELNEKWDQMSLVINSHLTRSLIALGPILEGTASKVANLTANIGDFVEWVSKLNAQGSIVQLRAIEEEIGRIQSQVENMPKEGLLESIFGGREAAERQLQILRTQRDALREAVTHPMPKLAIPGPVEPTGDLVGADRTKAAKTGGRSEQSDRDRALKTTLEEITALKSRNAILFESIKTHQTVAQAQARILEIENARQTGLPGLAAQLTALTTRENALTEALTQQAEIQKQLGEARSFLPQQTELLTRGLADNLPFEEIRRQLEGLAQDSSLTTVFKNAGFDQPQIDSVLQMSSALRAFQRSAEEAEQRAEFISETTRSLQEQIAAEQTRATLLSRAIGQNQRYDDLQREIEGSLDRLRLKQEALRLGATPEQIASLDALTQRYQQVESQTDALNEAIRRQAQDQQELHDLTADGIHGLGRAFLDMAEKGKFSFRTLLEAANDFADRIQDRLLGKLADQIADSIFPAESTPKPVPTLSTTGPAITGPFETSTLTQQLEGLQVPLVSTSTAGIQQLTLAGTTATQQLTLAGTTATQSLTQVSTTSLTSIQTTSTTGIASIQQVATAALAAIQAAAAQGGASGITSLLGSQGGGGGLFGNVISSSSSTAPGVDFSNVMSSSSSTAPVLNSIGSSSSGLTSLLSSLGQMGGMLSIIYQLGSLIGGATGSSSGGFIGGLFGGITGLISSLFHEGGTVGASSSQTRIAPAALFPHAPHFARGGIASLGLTSQELPAILHRGEIVVPAAVSQRLLARDDQMGDVMRAVAARRPVTPVLSPPRFELGGMVGMSTPSLGQAGETVLSHMQVKEIRQQTDIMPHTEGESDSGKKGQVNNFHFHGVTDFSSFKRNEQQVQATVARGLTRASRKNN